MQDHILVEEKKSRWEVSEVVNNFTERKSYKVYLEDALVLAILWMQENKDSGLGKIYFIQVKFL